MQNSRILFPGKIFAIGAFVSCGEKVDYPYCGPDPLAQPSYVITPRVDTVGAGANVFSIEIENTLAGHSLKDGQIAVISSYFLEQKELGKGGEINGSWFALEYPEVSDNQKKMTCTLTIKSNDSGQGSVISWKWPCGLLLQCERHRSRRP